MTTAQASADHGWLVEARSLATAPRINCVCDASLGSRWPGYLGRAFATHGVLFIGGNHNGRHTGLAGSPAMHEFHSALSTWARTPQDDNGDRDILDHMRRAYRASWSSWGIVWQYFREIRIVLGIPDDGFAFRNLALCAEPESVDDDAAIAACQSTFPISRFAERIGARVAFLAKGGSAGKLVESQVRAAGLFVWRYDNGSRGNHQGTLKNGSPTERHFTKWLPAEASALRAIVEDARR